jgi:hypothetical protein
MSPSGIREFYFYAEAPERLRHAAKSRLSNPFSREFPKEMAILTDDHF